MRVSRAVEYALTKGRDDGSDTALPSSPAGGLLASVATGVTQSSLSVGIPYASLVALAGSVDHANYEGGAVMGSPSVFDYFVGQLDTTGRPLRCIDDNEPTLILNLRAEPHSNLGRDDSRRLHC
jgi:hypothetical protein